MQCSLANLSGCNSQGAAVSNNSFNSTPNIKPRVDMVPTPSEANHQALLHPKVAAEVECPATPASNSVDSPKQADNQHFSSFGAVSNGTEAVRSCGAQPQCLLGVADKGRREYAKWTPEEEEIFYSTLRTVAGQKPEKCLTEIAKRLTSKDYCQVRHYYYRLLKRLNKVLGEERKLDSKNNLQVHQSIIKFWDVFVQNGIEGTCIVGVLKQPKEKKAFNNGLQKGVQDVIFKTQQVDERTKRHATKRKVASDYQEASFGLFGAQEKLPKRSKGVQLEVSDDASLKCTPSEDGHEFRSTIRIGCCDKLPHNLSITTCSPKQDCDGVIHITSSLHAPIKPTLGFMPGVGLQHRQNECSVERPSPPPCGQIINDSKVPQRLTLQLLPCNQDVEATMEGYGNNPFLEVTFSSNKSLASLLKHLSKKWMGAMPVHLIEALYLHPVTSNIDSMQGLKWGGAACNPTIKVKDIYKTLQCPTPFQLMYNWDSYDVVKDLPNGFVDATKNNGCGMNELHQRNLLHLLDHKKMPEKTLQCVTDETAVETFKGKWRENHKRGDVVLEARRPRGLLGLLQPVAHSKAPMLGYGPRDKSLSKENIGYDVPQKGKVDKKHHISQSSLQMQNLLARARHLDHNAATVWQDGLVDAQKATNPQKAITSDGQPRKEIEDTLARHLSKATDTIDPSLSLLNFLDGTTGFLEMSSLLPLDHNFRQKDGMSQPISLFGQESFSAWMPSSKFFGIDDLYLKMKETDDQVPPFLQANIIDLQSGPTNFSQLFANMDMPNTLSYCPKEIDNNTANSMLNSEINLPTTIAKAAIDALLGQAGFNTDKDHTQVQPGKDGKQQQCTLYQSQDKNLEQLAASFESLLGVENTPRCFELNTGGQKLMSQEQRPFASLFDK